MPRYDDSPTLMGYLFRFLLIALAVIVLGFFAYAFLGDLSRPSAPQVVPVELGRN